MEMMTPDFAALFYAALTLALLGWILAAFCLALYLGERGRRRDLAWLVDRERKSQQPAVVRNVDEPEDRALELITEEQMERLTNDIVRNRGVDPKVAREDAEKMVEQVQRLGGEW